MNIYFITIFLLLSFIHVINNQIQLTGVFYCPTQIGTTNFPTTQFPTTNQGTTNEGTTNQGTTNEGTTLFPTTNQGTTQFPTTNQGTTEFPTTNEGTTEFPTTLFPTTEFPTTNEGTTNEGTTEFPTTLFPTTLFPTTLTPTTEFPTTEFPTTEFPTTCEGTTNEGTTNIPTTEFPTTLFPTTEFPTTNFPTTEFPTTNEGTTEFPTTLFPTTEFPTTEFPTTEFPTTNFPTTEFPTTEFPTTNFPTTEFPTTNIPTTNFPTTLLPTTIPPENMCNTSVCYINDSVTFDDVCANTVITMNITTPFNDPSIYCQVLLNGVVINQFNYFNRGILSNSQFSFQVYQMSNTLNLYCCSNTINNATNIGLIQTASSNTSTNCYSFSNINDMTVFSACLDNYPDSGPGLNNTIYGNASIAICTGTTPIIHGNIYNNGSVYNETFKQVVEFCNYLNNLTCQYTVVSLPSVVTPGVWCITGNYEYVYDTTFDAEGNVSAIFTLLFQGVDEPGNAAVVYGPINYINGTNPCNIIWYGYQNILCLCTNIGGTIISYTVDISQQIIILGKLIGVLSIDTSLNNAFITITDCPCSICDNSNFSSSYDSLSYHTSPYAAPLSPIIKHKVTVDNIVVIDNRNNTKNTSESVISTTNYSSLKLFYLLLFTLFLPILIVIICIIIVLYRQNNMIKLIT